MTTDDKVDWLFDQITELPDQEQAELLRALVEIRAEHFGVHAVDEDERRSLRR